MISSVGFHLEELAHFWKHYHYISNVPKSQRAILIKDLKTGSDRPVRPVKPATGHKGGPIWPYNRPPLQAGVHPARTVQTGFKPRNPAWNRFGRFVQNRAQLPSFWFVGAVFCSARHAVDAAGDHRR